MTPEEFFQRAESYAQKLSLRIERQLGFGVQGTVYSSSRRTAIKVHEREVAYQRERDAYLRLRDCVGITFVGRRRSI
jgi:hypothetical protein